MAGSGPTPPTQPPGRSWGLVLLTAVVVAALATPVVIAAVARLSDDSDQTTSSPSARRSTSPSAAPSPSPTPSPSTTPSNSPSRTPSRSPSSPSATPGGATCWDGSQATSVSACSEPDGEAGLRYVFPSAAYEKCGHPTQPDQTGLVLRMLCTATLGDGSEVVIGYSQWDSVDAAVTYFEGQAMQRSDQTDAAGEVTGYQFFGEAGPAQKVAGLYADEPFSVAVELPLRADSQQAMVQLVKARPAGEVRGQPNP